jgi:hypothetical protein
MAIETAGVTRLFRDPDDPTIGVWVTVDVDGNETAREDVTDLPAPDDPAALDRQLAAERAGAAAYEAEIAGGPLSMARIDRANRARDAARLAVLQGG